MDVRASLHAALVAVALAGCTADDGAAPPATTASREPPPPPTTTELAPPPTTTEAEPEPVALVPMPRHGERLCRRFPVLATACPKVVPDAPWKRGSPIYSAASHAAYPAPGAWAFTLQWGGEHPGAPELDRPPDVVHVVVTAGPAFGEALPRRRLREGLLETRRRSYLLLGRATWGDRSGVIVLAPQYPLGGIESNHVIFRWIEGGYRLGVSLHGWEPLTEVPVVLRELVESIPPQR